jgi:hypothetical protein
MKIYKFIFKDIYKLFKDLYMSNMFYNIKKKLI